jgi:hypothetical protein
MLSNFHTLFLQNVRLMVVVLTVFALPTLLNAQSVLTDDAHTKDDAVSGNFGSNPALNISPGEIAYLKFKISSTLPAGTAGSDLARATLRLYIGNVKSPGKIDVYLVTSAWNESSVTFNSAPSIGNLIATSAQIQTEKNKFLVIDLTAAVAQWLGDDGRGTNGVPNNGLAVMAHPVDAETPTLASVVLDSKENSQTSHEPELMIALKKSSGLQSIAHDATLKGDGKNTDPLGVANLGIDTAQLADNAVNAQKIAAGQVVKSINGLSDGVTLQAGTNITITPSGNTLTIDSINSGVSAVSHNTTLSGDGSSATPLSVAAPLALSGSDSDAILSVANAGSGPAINATGDINTNTRYNIGGSPVLSVSASSNTFVGVGTGPSNTGTRNSFFGSGAGRLNTTGFLNAFFGAEAGASNTTGVGNAFFGNLAGQSNTGGNNNTFLGNFTGVATTSGAQNTFVGGNVGSRNTTGIRNSFVGMSAGQNNTTGSNNTFFGDFSGPSNSSEDNNTFIGARANGAAGITNATALGYFAIVTQSNSLVLGNNASVGIGTTGPGFKLHVIDSGNTGLRVQTDTPGGTVASFGGNGNFQVDAPGVVGGRFLLTEGGKVGIGTATPTEKLSVAGTIQSTSGGFKFPDGTVQTTAALLSSSIGETHTAYIPGIGNGVDVSPFGSQPSTIHQLNLPAGNYLLLATINFVNSANFPFQDNRRLIFCNFPNSFYKFRIEGVGNDNEITQTWHTVVSLTQPGTVNLQCVAADGGTDSSFVRAVERNITAIRIGEIK